MYENPPLSVVGGLTHSDAVSPTKTGKRRLENQTPYIKECKPVAKQRQRLAQIRKASLTPDARPNTVNHVFAAGSGIAWTGFISFSLASRY